MTRKYDVGGNEETTNALKKWMDDMKPTVEKGPSTYVIRKNTWNKMNDGKEEEEE